MDDGDESLIEEELKKGFETLEIVDRSPIYHVYLNRPAHRNALTLSFFTEFPRVLYLLGRLPYTRAVVLSSRGPHFCSGIDLSALGSVSATVSPADLRLRILSMQAAISAIESCRKPVIAVIHGACIGGGVDLVSACDLRYCDKSAYFSVKEVDLALTADLGSLQRLPAIVGYGNAMEMALTGRAVTASEAKEMGLVSRVLGTREELEKGAEEIAKNLAEKSAGAVMGTKEVMIRSRDMSVEKGLDYVATWNAAMLRSKDLEAAVRAKMEKRKPVFSSKM